MAFIGTWSFANYPTVAIIGYVLTSEIQISMSVIKHCVIFQEMFSALLWRKSLAHHCIVHAEFDSR